MEDDTTAVGGELSARHLLAHSCKIKTWDDNEDGIYFEDAFDLLGNSSVTDDKKLKKRPSTKTNKMIFVKKKLENLSKQADKFDEDMTKSFNLK